MEEACDTEDEAKAEKLEQRRDQVVGELQDAEDALHGYAPDVREVAGAIVTIDRPDKANSLTAGMLRDLTDAFDRIAATGASCWLVNTGWTGGAFGTGKRMPIAATRALLAAALDGSLNDVQFRKDPNFGFEVPVSVPGVEDKLLDPRQTWADPAAYDKQAAKLVQMFSDNFAQYLGAIDDEVRAAAIG